MAVAVGRTVAGVPIHTMRAYRISYGTCIAAIAQPLFHVKHMTKHNETP
jgi:hypothetical protein